MIITTKAELERAQKRGDREIIIEGELAEKIRKGRKVTSASKPILVILTGSIAAIPFTGGMSAAAFASVAALTGLEIALITAVVFVGLGLILAIWKDYEEVEFSHNPLRLKLRKKAN